MLFGRKNTSNAGVIRQNFAPLIKFTYKSMRNIALNVAGGWGYSADISAQFYDDKNQ